MSTKQATACSVREGHEHIFRVQDTANLNGTVMFCSACGESYSLSWGEHGAMAWTPIPLLPFKSEDESEGK